jgi:hypothetical protein
MDMQIARLVNISWLRVPERQDFAMRAILLSSLRSRAPLDGPPDTAAQPVPMLAWPANLFSDEKLDN